MLKSEYNKVSVGDVTTDSWDGNQSICYLKEFAGEGRVSETRQL